ncbi:MAG: hypothetical protein ACLFO2_00480 [Candidatus Woesearchaeota archaeon]
MTTKAQGLSMNVIIIAAISLLVLVIISVLVLRAGGNVNESTGCQGVNGVCVGGTSSYASCRDLGQDRGGDYIRDPSHGCDEEGQYCCIPLHSDQ